MKKVKRFDGIYCRDSDRKRFDGRPDRCFYICIKIHGKNVWEKVGWMSEGYTAQFAAQVRSERIRDGRHSGGLRLRKANPTFAEIWKIYDEGLAGNPLRQQNDRSRYRRHIEPRIGDLQLSEISPFDLEKMKAELTKEGLAPATVKHCLVLVRQVINRAIAWGLWYGENPIKKVKLPRLSNARERFLSPDEARRLLDELAKHGAQIREMAEMSLHTGMRAGEIFGLRWGHIDIDNGLIHVSDPKGGEPRKVIVTDEVEHIISERQRGGQEEHVFPARGGGRIPGVSKVYFDTVKRLGFNAGITDRRQRVTFHTLRHTFGSWLAMEGVPIRTLQDLMGHKTIQMTMRYSHLSPDHRREAAEKIGARMGTVGSKVRELAEGS